MQINNNFTNQPNFTSLKSIRFNKAFKPTNNPDSFGLMESFYKSKAVSELCEKYNVNARFSLQEYPESRYPNVELLLEITEKGSNLWQKMKNKFKSPVRIGFANFVAKSKKEAYEITSRRLSNTTYKDMEQMIDDVRRIRL